MVAAPAVPASPGGLRARPRLSGRIREDGRVIRDMYLMQATSPDASKGERDGCPLVTK